MSQSLLSRLDLGRGDKWDSMLQGINDVASLPDPTGIVTYASELDDDYNIYKQSQGQEYDHGEAKKVVRKIDLRVVTVLFVIYLMQYLDKNGLNYSSVYGLQEGTNLHGQQYSWLSSKSLRLFTKRGCANSAKASSTLDI